jgi:hypothetical protein
VSHLNRNNNNSLATESLTAVTPIHTTQQLQSRVDPMALPPLVPRRNERGISSSAVITSDKDQAKALNQSDSFL